MSTHLTLEQLSLVSRDDDAELARIQAAISRPVRVGGRSDVEQYLGQLLASADPPQPRVLDLIGHSTPDRSLLLLGDWVIDGTSSKVTSFFRGLADCEVFERLNIQAVRLLGCETAASEAGRLTLLALSEIVNVEVFGTTVMLSAEHYDANGFRRDQPHVLRSATEVRRTPMFQLVKRGGEPYRRLLDLDAMPASPLERTSLQRRIATRDQAREILALVRRGDGAQMAGSAPAADCELALPSSKPGWYHRAQVVMDGEFLRVSPDGEDRPGVVFPVTDSKRLRELLVQLSIG